MLLYGLEVVLVRTRFPENIGMAARACANMGCGRLCLVAPERWELEKARPLATPKGLPLLERIRVVRSLAEAVAESTLVMGTTARLGGWRRSVLAADQAGVTAAGALRAGERVSLVFGSEDRGLSNEEVLLCQRLVTIPTDGEASSLNLAQAVLILLYECSRALRGASARSGAGGEQTAEAAPEAASAGRRITAAEQERLLEAFKAMLLTLDALHGDNPDYFLLPWRRLFGRAALRRHEYDALMGLCRQVRNKLGRKKTGD
ncbi:RNA methyltransferase [Desulfovibrio sp.]|uniref:RNA methyltransferase n=1 Tax=Desulfovibrio sp. TaxID=885 RepID=UPI0023D5D276|nr:RNA methyltransferase [Desulfovibrio sp.]MDE7240722.1 RNA methyltransferase [Desulfovibrio sp.]